MLARVVQALDINGQAGRCSLMSRGAEAWSVFVREAAAYVSTHSVCLCCACRECFEKGDYIRRIKEVYGVA